MIKGNISISSEEFEAYHLETSWIKTVNMKQVEKRIKNGRQEQTSKLQIKECEMQGRIADPYRARGLVEGWGDQYVRGGCASSLRTQSRGVSLWWRSVTWAHLGWGCSGGVTADTLARRPIRGSGWFCFISVPVDKPKSNCDSHRPSCCHRYTGTIFDLRSSVFKS